MLAPCGQEKCDQIERVAPMWLGDVLLRNVIPQKDVVKISFVLEPFNNELPSIAGITAPAPPPNTTPGSVPPAPLPVPTHSGRPPFGNGTLPIPTSGTAKPTGFLTSSKHAFPTNFRRSH